MHTLPVSAYFALFNVNRAFQIVRRSPTEAHKAAHDNFAKHRARELPLP
jgi:hypothetical protein